MTSLAQHGEAQGLKMVVYEEPMATEVPQSTPFIHDHFQHAVRSILHGIKELFELFDSKIFTDNQKEKLTWGKFREAKALLVSISYAIKNLSSTIEEVMTEIAGKISEHLNDQTENVKGYRELMKLQSENNSMEQRLMEQDNKLNSNQKVVQEVSSSQALLTETLLKFIEDAKKGESSGGSGKEQRGQLAQRTGGSSKGFS
ncbi:hypothetical protein Dimus_018830, partial [Dionaea muscipula]